jgi:hypothetical protein
MRSLFLYIVTPIVSFLGGFFAYAFILKISSGESLEGDGDAVLFWGGIAFFLLGVPVYFGIIYLIDHWLKRLKWLYYPIGCMLVFFIPTALIALSFGSLNLLSPEAMLFHSFFLTSGLIFGLCVGGIKSIKSKSVI